MLFNLVMLFFWMVRLDSLVGQMVNCLSTMWETQVRSLGWEDPLEKEMAIHSRTITWKTPLSEEPGRLQSMGSQRVGHNWATSLYRLDSKTELSHAWPQNVFWPKKKKNQCNSLNTSLSIQSLKFPLLSLIYLPLFTFYRPFYFGLFPLLLPPPPIPHT